MWCMGLTGAKGGKSKIIILALNYPPIFGVLLKGLILILFNNRSVSVQGPLKEQKFVRSNTF